jgi:hypothetical protein
MMSKLSGILPPTARILSTDISRAQPLRGGAPRFWGMSEEAEAPAKSVLTESALDRVSWSPNGKQGLADPAIPSRQDEFLSLMPDDGSGDFSPIAQLPSPVVGLPEDIVPTASGRQLDIRV